MLCHRAQARLSSATATIVCVCTALDLLVKNAPEIEVNRLTLDLHLANPSDDDEK